MCFFGWVGRQTQINQRALQEAIQGGRLSLAHSGAQGAGKIDVAAGKWRSASRAA